MQMARFFGGSISTVPRCKLGSRVLGSEGSEPVVAIWWEAPGYNPRLDNAIYLVHIDHDHTCSLQQTEIWC